MKIGGICRRVANIFLKCSICLLYIPKLLRLSERIFFGIFFLPNCVTFVRIGHILHVCVCVGGGGVGPIGCMYV